jgi:hypothetical protein
MWWFPDFRENSLPGRENVIMSDSREADLFEERSDMLLRFKRWRNKKG